MAKVWTCEKRKKKHTRLILTANKGEKKKSPPGATSTMWTVVFFPLQLTRCHSGRPHKDAGGVFPWESSHEMCYGVHRNDLKKVDRQEVAGAGVGGCGGGDCFFSSPPLATLVTYLSTLALRAKVLRCQNRGLTTQIPTAPLPLNYLPPHCPPRPICTCQGSAASDVSLPEQQTHAIIIHLPPSASAATFRPFFDSLSIYFSLPSK